MVTNGLAYIADTVLFALERDRFEIQGQIRRLANGLIKAGEDYDPPMNWAWRGEDFEDGLPF
jgi:hypothetical protein